MRSAAAAAIAIAGQVLLAASDAHAVSAPIALAQAAIALMPGPAATAIVGLLHEWAMRASIGGAVAALVAAATLSGAARRPLLGLLLWLTGPVVGLLLPSLSADGPATAGSAALGAALYVAAALPPGSRASDPSRRRLLLASSALLGLAVLAAAGLRAARRAAAAIVPGAALVAHADAAPAPLDDAVDPPLVAAGAPHPDVTPNGDFYVVKESIVDPTVTAETWRLEVRGAVRSAFAVGYGDLVSLPAVEQHQTLECISNEVGGDLIGNTTWLGVRVRDLLERAGPLDGTRKVLFRSVEGYSSAIPLEAAMLPTTLVAYGMAGSALPREHGFPARLLIPGRYGMKNVKWLSAIEAVRDDRLGFWESRGWDDDALAETMSRIVVPRADEKPKVGVPLTIAGVAYAGDRGVAKVEVSTDAGATWRAATLGRRFSSATWRRWAYVWTPPSAGWHRIAVRAWDDRGRPQIGNERPPLPMGATGIHSYQIEARG